MRRAFRVYFQHRLKRPGLAGIGGKTVKEDATLTFTATAADLDLPAAVLNFSLVGSPGGASINRVNRQLRLDADRTEHLQIHCKSYR
ncbi:MAG: hypothetical protein M3525_13530 [Acidobacteriota bacterium]|nr:hypothetical protein [Acidobacteriota bacterium]